MIATLQSYEIGTISEASSETDKNQKISCLEVAFPNGVIKGERDRSRRGIPIFFDGNDHLFFHGPTG